MTELLLVPDDTLWLRGGRPFVAGEDSADAGLFPPTPWTFQGVVRTHLLEAMHPEGLTSVPPSTIQREIGPPDALPPGWRLQGPLPARATPAGVEPWVPWPRCLELDTRGRSRLIQRLPAASTLDLRSFPPRTAWVGSPAAEPARGWLAAGNLVYALCGWGTWDPDGLSLGSALPPFVEPELRTGLVIDDTSGRAADSMLYAAVHHRLHPGAGLWGALLGADGAALQAGTARVGRKGRPASLLPGSSVAGWRRLLDGGALVADRGRTPDVVDLWVVLLTPAVARPATAGATPLPFERPAGVAIEVVAVLGGPGEPVGGFDRLSDGGRPTRAVWAAGTSVWLRLSGGSPADRVRAARHLHGLQALDDDERLGFGLRIAIPFDPDTGAHAPLEDALG